MRDARIEQRLHSVLCIRCMNPGAPGRRTDGAAGAPMLSSRHERECATRARRRLGHRSLRDCSSYRPWRHGVGLARPVRRKARFSQAGRDQDHRAGVRVERPVPRDVPRRGAHLVEAGARERRAGARCRRARRRGLHRLRVGGGEVARADVSRERGARRAAPDPAPAAGDRRRLRGAARRPRVCGTTRATPSASFTAM